MQAEMTDIGSRLRSLRESKKLTQQQLATAAGLSLSVLSRIEYGGTPDPRISTLRALAKALGVSLDDLAGEEDSCDASPS